MNQQLFDDWIKEGIVLNPPATIEEIRNCERKIGFTFPEDFVAFYNTACNGFENNQMDEKRLMLWSLDRIMSDNDSSDFIAFADYLINSSQIGFIKNKPGVYKEVENWQICQSFTEFLEHWQSESGEYI